MVLTTSVFAQSSAKTLSTETFYRAINTGVVIVEFNANFAKSFGDWHELEGCKYYTVDIEKYPVLKDKYKIRVVPTIILFHNGVKSKAWKANIMLELDVTVQEIQKEIEQLLSSQF
jgi:hypothetical protein